MTGRERKRRLARERYERNLARRIRTRRRKRYVVIGAVVMAALVGGTSALALTLGLPSAAGSRSAGGNAAATDGSASPRAAGAGPCSYERLLEAQRGGPDTFVGMSPESPEPREKYRARLEIDRGPIVIDLLNGAAPCT